MELKFFSCFYADKSNLDSHKIWSFPSVWPTVKLFSPFSTSFLFALCNVANCAPPPSSRSRGALQQTRHAHIPERCWLGSLSQGGSDRTVWHSSPNHASTTNTSAARRRGILWVYCHATNTSTHFGFLVSTGLFKSLMHEINMNSFRYAFRSSL